MTLMLAFMLLLAGEKGNAQPTQTNGRAEEKQTNSQPAVTPLDNAPAPVNDAANTASPSQTQERDTKDDPFKAEQLRQGRIIVWATVCIALFGGLSFLAALIYAIVSIKQWKAIDKQAGTMGEALTETRTLVSQNERAVKAAEQNVEMVEQTAIYAQRAYLTTKIKVVDDRLWLDLLIENSGSTPANEILVSYTSEFRETEPDGLDADFARHEKIGLMPPRGDHNVRVYPTSKADPEMEKRFEKRQLNFYCWGLIRYADIFEKGRRTWFCFGINIGLTKLIIYPCGRNEAK